jgi:hypothetical protein
MNYFCTYLDNRYLSRGLALYRSLKQHCSSFRIWVLCMDSDAYEALVNLDLPDVQPLTLAEFEREDEALLQAKQNRSLLEYYFTCTPSLPLFVLKHNSGVNLITYLDADLFFYSDPTPLLTELEGHSVGIIGHRFPEALRHLETLGIYNVGWLSFRRDDRAYRCLEWWRERCNEWCSDQPEEGRFADQKYLDDWPARFEGVAVLRHQGANLAPWNLANHEVAANRGQLWVEGRPLIFFHFHALRRISWRLFDCNLAHYGTVLSPLVRHQIYHPYLKALQEIEEQLPASASQNGSKSLVRHANAARSQGIRSLPKRFGRPIYEVRNFVKGLLARQYLMAPKVAPRSRGGQPARQSPVELSALHKARKVEGGKRTRALMVENTGTKPLISVITVVRNGEKHLEQAIRSVIHQPYPSIEYIVIDGASSDGTMDIIRRYDEHIDYWLSEPDQGIYEAMNKGWSTSRGDYVYYLGSDDVLLSLPISVLSEAYRQDIDIVFGDVRLSNGRQFRSRYGFQLLLNNTLHHQGLFLKRSLFDSSPFQEIYKVFSDFDLNQRLFKQRKRALAARETVAMFRLTRPSDQFSRAEFFQIVRSNFGVVVMMVSYLFLKARGFSFRLQGWKR